MLKSPVVGQLTWAVCLACQTITDSLNDFGRARGVHQVLAEITGFAQWMLAESA